MNYKIFENELKTNFIYLKLKYEDANYKIIPLYIKHLELDEFTINKIICFNSTPKHTIYVGVRENSESYVTEFYYDCPICDKTILLGDESRFKPHCEFSNKFLFIDVGNP